MKRNTVSIRVPKEDDILVLAKNRNIIYSYNSNGKSYNAFNVAVYLIPDNPTVTRKIDNDSVVAYNAPFDFATKEEIEKFKKVIINHAIKLMTSDEEDEYLNDVSENFTDYICEVGNITDKTLQSLVKEEVDYGLAKMRIDILEKYSVV